MSPRRVIHWLLMLAMTVALQAASGSTAQASCGDYLAGHGRHPSLTARETVPIQPSQPPASPLSKIPCNGPECQKTPSQPLAPAPVQLSQHETHQLVCLVAKLTLTTAKPTLADVDYLEQPRAGELKSIEHPPRA